MCDLGTSHSFTWWPECRLSRCSSWGCAGEVFASSLPEDKWAVLAQFRPQQSPSGDLFGHFFFQAAGILFWYWEDPWNNISILGDISLILFLCDCRLGGLAHKSHFFCFILLIETSALLPASKTPSQLGLVSHVTSLFWVLVNLLPNLMAGQAMLAHEICSLCLFLCSSLSFHYGHIFDARRDSNHVAIMRKKAAS